MPVSICLISFFLGEGFLTIETLSGILLELEPNLGKDELQDIIDEVDEDGSGTIDFDGKSLPKRNAPFSFSRNLAFVYLRMSVIP